MNQMMSNTEHRKVYSQSSKKEATDLGRTQQQAKLYK